MPPDVPAHVTVKFMDSAREYLGGRYGGAWIDQYDDTSRSISIAVVGPTDADRSKIGTLAAGRRRGGRIGELGPLVAVEDHYAAGAGPAG